MSTSYRMLFVIGASLVTAPVVGCWDPFSYGPREGGDGVPDTVGYEDDVYPLLMSRCVACHESGSSASASALVLSGDPAADRSMISALVTAGDPDGSALLQEASGAVAHSGGAVLDATSTDYQILASWIEAGAEQ